MIFRFAGDGDGLAGNAVCLDGLDFEPGSEHRATIEFWVEDPAVAMVKAGASFVVWYGGDVGDGEITAVL